MLIEYYLANDVVMQKTSFQSGGVSITMYGNYQYESIEEEDDTEKKYMNTFDFEINDYTREEV